MRALAIDGRDDLVVLEAPAELALDAGIVLDDQQFAWAIGHGRMLPQIRAATKATGSQNRSDAALKPHRAEERGDLLDDVLALLGRELRIDRQRQNLRGGALRLGEIARARARDTRSNAAHAAATGSRSPCRRRAPRGARAARRASRMRITY